MEHGQIVELTIEDMSAEGQGIGRVIDAAESERGGIVVFVKDAVPGDRVRVQLTKVKKNFAFGRIEAMLERSPHRNEEFDCPYFAEGCGGCPFACLDYEAQLGVKEQQVRNKLTRLAGLTDPVLRPIIGMEDEDNGGQGCFRYRNKAVFPVSTGGIITRKGGIVENLGEPAVGFYRAKSHEVVDCGDCYLQSMAAMAAADALRRFMEEDHITAFDPKWEKGLLRHLIVKTAFGTGEVMVVLVINGKGIPNAPKLVDMLDEAIYDVGYSLESVVVNINKATGKNVEKNKKKDRSEIRLSGEILGDEYVTIAGKPTITDVVGHLQYEISPASFFQVNPAQMRRLYDQVRAYVTADMSGAQIGETGAPANDAGARLDDTGASADSEGTQMPGDRKPIILDLYCGIGSIGLYCADLADMVIGIESVKEAVADANRNAVINGIVNARYLCGRAEEILPSYVGAGGTKGTKKGAAEQGVKAAAGINTVKIDAELQQYISRADIAILDPPRAGCRPELLEAVAQTGVQRIIYVSCDPATLARDIQLLQGMNYTFIEATPVDLFPHSGHVECVVLMSKNK